MSDTTIDAKKLETLELLHGSHPSAEAGMCAMEAVAWLAGEKHSDAPACTCPVIANAVIRLNDRIADGRGNRQTEAAKKLRTELLRPLLPKLIGTRTADRAVLLKRGYIAADMGIRVFAPMALEKRGRLDLAQKLRDLAEMKDQETAQAARKVTVEVWKIADAAAAAAAAYAADAAAAAAAAYAADAAAYAAAAAADAADAAAAAADAADEKRLAARREVYALGVSMIERMVECK